MSNPKVVFEAVPSRWRVENRIRADKWVGDQCFPTLAAATIYAQKWLDNNPDVYAYRVVDTQADMTTPRLSGPCSHGLPCTCDMPRTPRRPERRPQVTIPPQAVEAAAKAMYEQRPHATDPAHWETPWEDVPKTWRRGQLAAARAVLEAATPWLQATKNGGDQ